MNITVRLIEEIKVYSKLKVKPLQHIKISLIDFVSHIHSSYLRYSVCYLNASPSFFSILPLNLNSQWDRGFKALIFYETRFVRK